MQVRNCMTRDVRTLSPDRSIQDAARIMAESDVGAIPIGQDDRLVGMITDRDIAIRAVGEGKDPRTPIEAVMTRQIRYCFEDEELEHVARNMADVQLRRLPVLSRDKRLVGILALGDLAAGGPELAATALDGISRPASFQGRAQAAH